MRLIDADALKKQFPENIGVGLWHFTGVWAVIANAPTIEAELVRHGEWCIFRDGCVLLAECSECGTVQSGIAAAQWDYCPMCGSRMDGGTDDATD